MQTPNFAPATMLMPCEQRAIAGAPLSQITVSLLDQKKVQRERTPSPLQKKSRNIGI